MDIQYLKYICDRFGLDLVAVDEDVYEIQSRRALVANVYAYQNDFELKYGFVDYLTKSEQFELLDCLYNRI